MGWSTTSDPDRFAAVAGGYLSSRTAENTLLLSAVQDARRGERTPQAQHQAEALYGWWTPSDAGEPRGAFVHDPAVPLLISARAPETAAALAATLTRLGRQVCGVDAPTEAADAFAAAWSQRAGATVRAHQNCRVYRLTAQETRQRGTASPGVPAVPGAWPPAGVSSPSGRLRVAATGDLTMLADWLRASAIEATQRLPSPAGLAADLISYGGAVFWEVPRKPGLLRESVHHLAVPHHRGVQPVALVTLARPVAGTVRINMVYTLPERRRSGYAAAVTQAVSRALLSGTAPDGPGPDGPGPDNSVPGLLCVGQARGCVREVVMITDKNRPDQWAGRAGYRLVSERAVLRFGPATGAMPRANPTGPMPRLPTGPLPRLPRFRR